jgi:uncharacterized spore protein YtfJ
MDTQKIKNIIETITQPFQNTSIKKIYGEPINVQGKTIIPVARLTFGFGGGLGEKKGVTDDQKLAPSAKNSSNEGGGGLGGGMAATPIGYIEVTPERTRFVRFDVMKYVFAGLGLGLLFGKFLFKKP